MTPYIIKALQKGESICVNDLGTFSLHYVPANISGKVISAPHNIVTFDAHTGSADYAFTDLVCFEKKCLITQASNDIIQWVEELKQALNHNKSVTFEGFGTFSLNDKGKISFSCDHIPELNLEFEGLEDLRTDQLWETEDVRRETEEPRPETEELRPETEELRPETEDVRRENGGANSPSVAEGVPEGRGSNIEEPSTLELETEDTRLETELLAGFMKRGALRAVNIARADWKVGTDATPLILPRPAMYSCQVENPSGTEAMLTNAMDIYANAAARMEMNRTFFEYLIENLKCAVSNDITSKPT